MDTKDIAKALEQCDWSEVSIGNKVVVRAAVAELRRLNTENANLKTKLANTENQLVEADATVQEMQALIDGQGL